MTRKTLSTTTQIKRHINLFKENNSYKTFLKAAKEKVRTAQIKASLAINCEMLIFYWELGQMMLKEQQKTGWGGKWIEQFSADLQESFPEQSGFSRSNLHYMRKFAEIYPKIEIVQQLVGQLPWGQNILLLSITDDKERTWYTQKTIEEG